MQSFRALNKPTRVQLEISLHVVTQIITQNITQTFAGRPWSPQPHFPHPSPGLQRAGVACRVEDMFPVRLSLALAVYGQATDSRRLSEA